MQVDHFNLAQFDSTNINFNTWHLVHSGFAVSDNKTPFYFGAEPPRA